MELALRTLFGNVPANSSLDLYKLHTKEAITGAVKACWPSLPHEQVRTLVHGIIELWAVEDNSPFPFSVKGRPCGNLTSFPVEGFYNFLDSAFAFVMDSDPIVANYFENVASTCQHECKDKTIPLAAATMFRAGTMDNKNLSVDALAGAMKACAPDVPHGQISDFATKILEYRPATMQMYEREMAP